MVEPGKPRTAKPTAEIHLRAEQRAISVSSV
jgi:hypothetical protein